VCLAACSISHVVILKKCSLCSILIIHNFFSNKSSHASFITIPLIYILRIISVEK